MPLDLIHLNNAIVGLRGPVQQARVHAVHKLVRSAAALRAKKGTDEQRAKNSRKADRMTEEATSLKAAGRDDLARFALRNRKSLEQVLDKTDDLATRGMVRVAAHPSVSSKVGAFREANPDWEGKIQSLMDRLGRVQNKKSPGVKAKKKQKKRIKEEAESGKEKKEAKETRPNNDEERGQSKKPPEPQEDDEEEEDSGRDDEKDFVSSLRGLIKASGSGEEFGGEEEEEEGSDDEEDSGAESNGEDSDESEQEDEERGSEDDDGDDDDSENEEKEADANRQKGDKVFRREGVMEIKTLDMDGESDESSSEENEEGNVRPPPRPAPSAAGSSFFLGGESDPDESDREEKGGRSDGEDKKPDFFAMAGYRNEEPGPRGRARGGRRGRGRSDRGGGGRGRGVRGDRGRGRGAPGGRGGPRGDRGRGRPRSEGWSGSRESAEGGSLHPSWAAKRKAQQGGGPAAFRGKKIKFDGGAPRDHAEPGQSQLGSEKLHPSWAAKKQKNQIADFKGKKTVFE